MRAEGQETAGGKRKLVQAALRLCARERSLGSLGLRELGREAGLNPNTFYRHFRDLDELGLAIILEITGDLRSALQKIRRSAAGAADATERTVRYFFDFVRRNPEAFVIAVRELHGASPVMRRALRQLIADMAADMAQDIRAMGLVPGLDDESVGEITRMIVHQMFYLSLEYVENPRQRRAIVDHAVRFILMLAAGALAFRGLDVDASNLR